MARPNDISPGEAEQHDEEQVGDKEGGSAKLRNAVREQPDA